MGKKKDARSTRSLRNHFAVVTNSFCAWENVLQPRGRSKAWRRLARPLKSADLFERVCETQPSISLHPGSEGTPECSSVYLCAAPPLCHDQKGRRLYVTSPPQPPPPSSSWEPHSRLRRLWIIKFHGLARESSTGQIWIIDQDRTDVHSRRLRVQP